MSARESPQNSIQAAGALQSLEPALGYRWAILFAVVLVHTTAVATFNALPPLAPFFQEEFRLTIGQVGVYMSAHFFGSAMAHFPGGWAADVIGTRRALFWGVFAGGVCFAAFSQAPTNELALAWTVAVGLAIGFASPAWIKAIALWFPPAGRATAMGINQMSNPLGGLITSFALPPLAIVAGWRLGSLTVAAVTLASVLIGLAIYRPHPTGETLTAAISSATEFTRIKEVITNRNVWLVGIFGNLLIAAQAIFLSYLILYLRDELLLEVVVAARFLGLGQLGGGLGRIGWGFASDRLFRGNRTTVLGLILVLTATASLATALLPASVPSWLLASLVMFFGITAVGWHGVYLTLLAELAPRQSAATALGLGMALFSFGGVLGPPLFGTLVDITGSYRLGWGLLAAVVLAGLPLLRLIREGQKSY